MQLLLGKPGRTEAVEDLAGGGGPCGCGWLGLVRRQPALPEDERRPLTARAAPQLDGWVLGPTVHGARQPDGAAAAAASRPASLATSQYGAVATIATTAVTHTLLPYY
eukprot:SAG31_NODE_2580_length_5438_cov_8.500843_9_plen_108_part_00